MQICLYMYICTYGYMDICICIYIYRYIYMSVELPAFGLRQGGREGGWCTARCSNFRNKSAGSVFFEENQSRSSRDPVGQKFWSFWHHAWTLKSQKKSAVFNPAPTAQTHPCPYFPFPLTSRAPIPPLLHQKCRMYMFTYIYG